MKFFIFLHNKEVRYVSFTRKFPGFFLGIVASLGASIGVSGCSVSMNRPSASLLTASSVNPAASNEPLVSATPSPSPSPSPSPTYVAPTLTVQEVGSNVLLTSQATITMNFATPIAPGESVVVIATYAGTLGPGTCVDGAARAFTQRATVVGIGWTETTFTYLNHPGGTSALTFTAPGVVSNKGIIAWRVSSSGGGATIQYADSQLSTQVSPGTATNVLTTPALSLSGPNGLVLGISLNVNNDGNLSLGTGFTASGSGHWNNFALAERRTLSSPGSLPMTWTTSSGSDSFISGALALQTPAICSGSPTNYNSIGRGITNDPFVICNETQLLSLMGSPAGWDSNYRLDADLDLNTMTPSMIGTKDYYVAEDPFTGTFDGNGHTISNFTLSGPTGGNKATGLFGYVLGATIKNLGLINPSVVLNSQWAGGPLVGAMNLSTVTNCYVSGGSMVGTTGDYDGIGGLIGFAETDSIISMVWSSASVDASIAADLGAGGLIGTMLNSTLKDAYSTGAVTCGNSPVFVGCGGLIGGAQGSVLSNVLTTGDVLASSVSHVGGLVGLLNNSGSVVTNTFATGNVTGNSAGGNEVGKLIGATNAGYNPPNSFTRQASTCTNVGTGNLCNSYGTEISLVATPTYFMDPTNAPLSSWDFGGGWISHLGTNALPTLKTRYPWSSIENSGALSDRHWATAVWTGTEALIWGGANFSNVLRSDGKRYNAGINTWGADMATAGAPSTRAKATSVWTGTEMLVWGGWDGGSTVATGGRYNPSTNLWGTPINPSGAPSAREWPSSVWTGTEMLVWGGGVSATVFDTGGRYNPATNLWGTALNPSGAPSARNCAVAVWTGTEMLVWGGWDGTSIVNTGGRYDPVNNVWGTAITTVGAPSARTCASAVWDGTEMIVWGGFNASVDELNDGARYNPATNTWRGGIVQFDRIEKRAGHIGVWTGSSMLIWGGSNQANGSLSTGWIYTP